MVVIQLADSQTDNVPRYHFGPPHDLPPYLARADVTILQLKM